MTDKQQPIKPRLVYGKEGPEHHTHHCAENGAYRRRITPETTAGWCIFGTTEPYPQEWLNVGHYCKACVQENVRMRPTEVEAHVRSKHGMSLADYVERYAHTAPQFELSVAEWREP